MKGNTMKIAEALLKAIPAVFAVGVLALVIAGCNPEGKETPAGKPSSSEHPTAEHPTAEQPTAEDPKAEKPKAEHPSSEHPSSEHPK